MSCTPHPKLRKLIALSAAFFVLCPVVRASYVSSGNNQFTFQNSTSCVPNAIAVTAGHSEVMGVQVDVTSPSPTLSISSTRVSSWTLDGEIIVGTGGGGQTIYMWRGVAASSGAETITVTGATGSPVLGSVCGEYTQTVLNATTESTNNNAFNSWSITTTANSADIVGIASATSSGNPCNVTAPWNTRNSSSFLGGIFLILFDQSITSTGTYTAANNTGSPTQGFIMDALGIFIGYRTIRVASS